MNKKLITQQLAQKIFEPKRHEKIVRQAVEESARDQQKMLDEYRALRKQERLGLVVKEED